MRKDETVLFHALNLTIDEGRHTASLVQTGQGSPSSSVVTHEERPLPLSNGTAPVRVFGDDNWNVWELRSQLDIFPRRSSPSGSSAETAKGASPARWPSSPGSSHRRAFFATARSPTMHRRAAESLEKMGVAHLAKRWLNEMSSGEPRRVLIARALVDQAARARAGRAHVEPRRRGTP